MRSMEAPVVPMKEARSAPTPRKAVFVRGVAWRSPSSDDPPEITKRLAQQDDERHVVEGGVEERLSGRATR